MEIPLKKDYLQPAGVEAQPVIPPDVARAGVTSTPPLTPSVEAQAVGVRLVGAEIPAPSQLEELTLSLGDNGIQRLLKEPITATGRWLGELLNRFRKKAELGGVYAG